MRNRYRRPRFAIALLTALAGAASTASADDVVVMPYRCAVVEGRPVLTPADETGHRVLGKLEKQKVKTCSTVDPKRCRQWATFKFDVDCGGDRVPWMQVFANASEHTRRRVWERNGRLRVQNTPQRSKRIDDMCARRMGVNQEWWSVNEICDEVSPLNAPTATDMPAGFAPMVGLDAVFLPESAIAMPPARIAKAAPAPAARAETASIQAAPQAKAATPAVVRDGEIAEGEETGGRALRWQPLPRRLPVSIRDVDCQSRRHRAHGGANAAQQAPCKRRQTDCHLSLPQLNGRLLPQSRIATAPPAEAATQDDVASQRCGA